MSSDPVDQVPDDDADGPAEPAPPPDEPDGQPGRVGYGRYPTAAEVGGHDPFGRKAPTP